MVYYLEIKETPESKSLLEHLRTLKYLKVTSQESKIRKYHFTDEEMALPGVNATEAELENWLTKPDKDKGTEAEKVRKRLMTKLNKKFS